MLSWCNFPLTLMWLVYVIYGSVDLAQNHLAVELSANEPKLDHASHIFPGIYVSDKQLFLRWMGMLPPNGWLPPDIADHFHFFAHTSRKIQYFTVLEWKSRGHCEGNHLFSRATEVSVYLASALPNVLHISVGDMRVGGGQGMVELFGGIHTQQ